MEMIPRSSDFQKWPLISAVFLQLYRSLNYLEKKSWKNPKSWPFVYFCAVLTFELEEFQ